MLVFVGGEEGCIFPGALPVLFRGRQAAWVVGGQDFPRTLTQAASLCTAVPLPGGGGTHTWQRTHPVGGLYPDPGVI